MHGVVQYIKFPVQQAYAILFKALHGNEQLGILREKQCVLVIELGPFYSKVLTEDGKSGWIDTNCLT